MHASFQGFMVLWSSWQFLNFILETLLACFNWGAGYTCIAKFDIHKWRWEVSTLPAAAETVLEVAAASLIEANHTL